jgi:hypothetical protein
MNNHLLLLHSSRSSKWDFKSILVEKDFVGLLGIRFSWLID